MSNPYSVDFDTLLSQILTDYKNLDPAPDVTQGSTTFIKGAVLTSCLWGLYRYQDYLLKQIFPDSADTENLNHWGSVFGIVRTVDDTDATYSTKILNALQQVSAGGNAQDYFNWALQSVNSGNAINANVPESFNPSAVNVAQNLIVITQDWVDGDVVKFTTTGGLPAPLVVGTNYTVQRVDATKVSIVGQTLTTQGTGVHTMTSQSTKTFYIADAVIVSANFKYHNGITPLISSPVGPGYVDVILMPSDEGILDPASPDYIYHTATTQLTNAAFAYIDPLRPVTAINTIVSCEVLDKEAILINAGPVTVDIATMTADVEAYINSLAPGDTLYTSQLVAICLRDGAVHAEVITPVVDVVPAYNTAVRYSSVTIVAEA